LTHTQFLPLIRALHAEIKGAYGWLRIWQELKAQGVAVGKERIRKLMQAHEIRGRHKRRTNRPQIRSMLSQSRRSCAICNSALSGQIRRG
jgi:hypothetical protein